MLTKTHLVRNLLLWLTLVSAPAKANLEGTAEDFYQTVIQINQSNLNPDDEGFFPNQLQANLQNLRVLFVEGYLNEAMPRIRTFHTGYWSENARALTTFGLPIDNIHYLKPPSRKSVKDNIPLFIKTVTNIPLKPTEQLLIIGHSKGAFLSTVGIMEMMNDPTTRNFVDQKIKGIIPIQMAAGSPVADYFYHYWWLGSGRTLHIPWKQLKKADKERLYSLGFGLAGIVVGGAIAPALRLCGQLKGLRSITTWAAKDLMESAQANCRAHHDILRRKFFYLGGSETVAGMPKLLRPAGKFLMDAAPPYDGQMLPLTATNHILIKTKPSDGLVPTAHMIPNFLRQAGCPFAILQMDHATPASDRIVSNDPYIQRATTMNALIQTTLR